MDTNNGLERVQRVFCWLVFVVDVSFWDDVVLFSSTYEVDVLLTMIVDRGFQSEMLINCLLELLTEIRNFLGEFLQFFAAKREEHSRCDGADTNRRRRVAQQVGFTEIFACIEKGNAEFLAVQSFLDDFGLSIGNDEEQLTVFALTDEVVAKCYFLGHKATCQSGDNGFVDVGEERNAAQALGTERRHAFEIADADALRLAQFYFCAVHTIGSAFHLHPWQELEEESGSDGAHLRGSLGGVRQFSGCSGRDATLQIVFAHVDFCYFLMITFHVVPSTCSVPRTSNPCSRADLGTLLSGSPSFSNTSNVSPLAICANLIFVFTKVMGQCSLVISNVWFAIRWAFK